MCWERGIRHRWAKQVPQLVGSLLVPGESFPVVPVWGSVRGPS
jgi:hypothetical protein